MTKDKAAFEKCASTEDDFSDSISLAKDRDGNYQQALARLQYKWFCKGRESMAISSDFIKAVKHLSFAAQTSGGTGGRDAELVAAIDEVGKYLTGELPIESALTITPEDVERCARAVKNVELGGGYTEIAQAVLNEFAKGRG